MKDQESWLESGLLLMGIIVVIAMTILVGGRAASSADRQWRLAKKHPERGDIGAERHQHISTVAAR